MKPIVFLLIAAILNSCNLKNMYETISNEDIMLNNAKQPFEISNEKMLIKTKIKGKSETLLFDTGATLHVLTDSLLFNINSKGNRVEPSFNLITTPDNNNVETMMGNFNIETQILEGKPSSANFIEMNFNKCDSIKGVFSPYNFIQEGKIIEINFSENFIKISDSVDVSNFKQVEAEFSKVGYLKISLRLNNKKEWFIFDTGADLPLICTQRIMNRNPNSKYLTINNLSYTNNIQNNIREINIYKNIQFLMGNYKGLVDVSSGMEVSNNIMGLMFIKRFNWIIDAKNKRVFFKERDNDRVFSASSRQYYCKNYKNLLVISAKNKNNKDFQLGDQIISVNNTLVAKDNLCDIQNYLNNTTDWSTIKIKTQKLN